MTDTKAAHTPGPWTTLKQDGWDYVRGPEAQRLARVDPEIEASLKGDAP